MEIFGSLLSFLTIVFVILLCCCHRKFIYADLKEMAEILHMYKTDVACIHSTPEDHILKLSPLHPDSEGGQPAKPLLAISSLIILLLTALGIFIRIWKSYWFKSSLMRVCFWLYPISEWLQRNACSIFSWKL